MGRYEGLPMTPGGYACVAADPPWLYGDLGSRIAPDYEMMPTPDICAMPVREIVAPRAHLWLWVTNSHLQDGLRVMAAWGFKYVANFVWVKVGSRSGEPSIGMGHYVRNAHELCLIGSRGGLVGLDRTVPSVLLAPRPPPPPGQKRTHSTKPSQALEMMAKVSPGPRLEMFSRTPRFGWRVWGRESGGVAA